MHVRREENVVGRDPADRRHCVGGSNGTLTLRTEEGVVKRREGRRL